MGACLSIDPDAEKARLRSQQIDTQLQHYANIQKNTIKILMLGKI